MVASAGADDWVRGRWVWREEGLSIGRERGARNGRALGSSLRLYKSLTATVHCLLHVSSHSRPSPPAQLDVHSSEHPRRSPTAGCQQRESKSKSKSLRY